MAIKLTDAQVSEYCLNLADVIRQGGKTYTGLFAVPMGGFPVAAYLCSLLQLPLMFTPQEGVLVVDDLIDSGRTLSKFSDYDTAVLICKNGYTHGTTYFAVEMNGWVVFPWESEGKDAKDAVVRMLEYIGENPKREGLLDTPKRVVASWDKLYGGYNQNADELLQRTFTKETYNQMVILRNISFYSTCEHHLLPFYGQVHISYIPKDRVVGISKLARVVEVFARRLQIQERLTEEIAGAIERVLTPLGTMVVVNGQHFCMTSRGVEKQDAVMTTSAVHGVFAEASDARNEFLSLISLTKR